MSRGYSGRRAKPRISFALASMFIALLVLLFSGGVNIQFNIEAITKDPTMFLITSLFATIAIALLYEW